MWSRSRRRCRRSPPPRERGRRWRRAASRALEMGGCRSPPWSRRRRGRRPSGARRRRRTTHGRGRRGRSRSRGARRPPRPGRPRSNAGRSTCRHTVGRRRPPPPHAAASAMASRASARSAARPVRSAPGPSRDCTKGSRQASKRARASAVSRASMRPAPARRPRCEVPAAVRLAAPRAASSSSERALAFTRSRSASYWRSEPRLAVLTRSPLARRVGLDAVGHGVGLLAGELALRWPRRRARASPRAPGPAQLAGGLARRFLGLGGVPAGRVLAPVAARRRRSPRRAGPSGTGTPRPSQHPVTSRTAAHGVGAGHRVGVDGEDTLERLAACGVRRRWTRA